MPTKRTFVGGSDDTVDGGPVVVVSTAVVVVAVGAAVAVVGAAVVVDAAVVEVGVVTTGVSADSSLESPQEANSNPTRTITGANSVSDRRIPYLSFYPSPEHGRTAPNLRPTQPKSMEQGHPPISAHMRSL